MKIILSILFVLTFTFAAFGQSNCPVTLSTNSVSINTGGNYYNYNYAAVDVTTASDCTWTAHSDGWIELIGSATQNTGAATITRTGSSTFYVAGGSNSGDPRQTSITVNNQTIAVTQGSGCIYSIQDYQQNFDAVGGSRNYPGYRNGGGPGGCTVTHTTDASWIHLGATTYTVDANTSAARRGTISYNYSSNYAPYPLVVYINQAAGTPAPTPTPSPTPTCTYSLGANNQSFTYTGGGGLIDVITQNGCAYTATNNDSFVTLQNSSGTGNSTINFDVGANSTGTTRTSTITVQGQIFTVTQSGGKTRKRVRFF